MLSIQIKKGSHCYSMTLFTFFLAPQGGLFSNQFWDELRVYATLNYLFIQVMKNHEVGSILIVLAIFS